jgi:pyruvate,water dikinase
LHYQELPELLAGRDFAGVIGERRQRRRAELRIEVPDVVTTDDLEAIGRPVTVAASGDALSGIALAPGSGTGPAAVVYAPAEAQGLKAGYVLVCPSTDPGWTPLFLQAAGLIMERGGVLSHGAVVARDLGIPAAVIKGATQVITAGEVIRVDGNAGVAYRVKKGSV